MRPLAILAFMLFSCTPAKTALDLSNAVCREIEQQNPNDEYVALTCSAIDVADGVAHTFQARVHKGSPMAAAAASAGCPKKETP